MDSCPRSTIQGRFIEITFLGCLFLFNVRSSSSNQNEVSLPQSISELNELKKELIIQEGLILEKAFKSEDPKQIIEAQKAAQEIQERQKINSKSIIIDPNEATSGMGYQQRHSVDFDTLRRMSNVPIIRSIISTRIEQVSSFTAPQPDKYSPGFIIQKKQTGNKVERPSRQESKIIAGLTDMVLKCGTVDNQWHGDDFDSFIRKTTYDSLVFDQMTAEIVRNKFGKPIEWFATDASTYRIADSYDDDRFQGNNKTAIKGYFPSYVQIYQGQIFNEFYPWELMFAARNVTTNISNASYGRSELEDLIYVITGILNADQYNMNFFKVGSAPKGFLKISGNVNENTIAQFKQHWTQLMQGVGNAHRTGIIESDQAEWIDLQHNSRDMEFQKFQEYLLQTCCSLYKIDPAEVGYKISGADGGGAALFESGNEAKLEHSKDKGLRSLLRFQESKLNKSIISQIAPEYEFKFVGLDAQDATQELDTNVKKLNNFMTLNEIRALYELDPVEGGDTILNGTYQQAMNMAHQREQEEQQAAQQQEQPEEQQTQEEDSPF